MTREATDGTFATEVLGSDRPVVVDFWAPWCKPCEAIHPILDALPLEVVRVNVDENPGVAARYGVLSLPTVILFEGGEPRAEVMGAQPPARFERAFADWLGH